MSFKGCMTCATNDGVMKGLGSSILYSGLVLG